MWLPAVARSALVAGVESGVTDSLTPEQCDGRHVVDLSPPELATPYFVVNRTDIQARLAALSEHMPGVAVHYAMKANPERPVLETVAAAGAGFEAASIFEIQMLLDIGVQPDRIIYGTAVKAAAHVAEAHALGVKAFAADSTREIDKLAACAAGSEVFVRIRVDDSDLVFAFGEKFGADACDIPALVRHVRDVGLIPSGLSFHVGSQSRRADAWARAIEGVASTYHRLDADGLKLAALNIGGGFPCQYGDGQQVPSIDQIGASVVAAAASLPDGTKLIAEPGRYLAAWAADLVTSVIGRTRRDGVEWVFLDAGCYNGLFEAMTYQGRTRYPIFCPTTSSTPVHVFSIAGPTGDSADVIAREVALPAGISEGDRVIVRHVGAYTMSASVPFNGFPRPRIIVQ